MCVSPAGAAVGCGRAGSPASDDAPAPTAVVGGARSPPRKPPLARPPARPRAPLAPAETHTHTPRTPQEDAESAPGGWDSMGSNGDRPSKRRRDDRDDYRDDYRRDDRGRDRYDDRRGGGRRDDRDRDQYDDRRDDRDRDYRRDDRDRDRHDGGRDEDDDRGGPRQRREEPDELPRVAGLLDRVGGMLAANREAKPEQPAAPAVPKLKVVAKYPVDPHGKGHDKEYKLPMTPFAAPAEVAAVRRDRESGAITYERKVSAFPVAIPDVKKGVDLTTSRKGSELCGTDPVGLEHLEAALKEGGKKSAAEGLDFICDSGSLQQLLATPYEPEKEWEIKVHIREAPTCILFEGCPSPLAMTGHPEGVSPEDWVQWGRNLKRLCLDGSPQAHFAAVLRTKLGGLRCALATSWECVDRNGPLLLPLAPVPAPSQPEGSTAVAVEPEVEERTRLYREKVLLHAWIECFLSGVKMALVGQCECNVVPAPTDEDGTVIGNSTTTAKLYKIRPTEPREMYRTAREHQLWDWNNTVHFGAAALKCVECVPIPLRDLPTNLLTECVRTCVGGCTSARLAKMES